MSSSRVSVDLVVIGNLLIDDLPHNPHSPGGAALFTALAARCCGLSVGVHSVVGTDYPLHWLEQAGVHLSLGRLDGPGGRTVIRYTPSGRTLLHRGPSHHELSPQIPHPFDAPLVHIAPMPTSVQKFHLANCSPRSALLDPYPWLDLDVWSEFQPHSERIACLLVNEEELRMDLQDIGRDVWTLHKKGARGGCSVHPDLVWQAADVEVVDQTGAGDAFAAGLAAGLLAKKSPQEVLEQGAEVASWALGAYGAEGLFRRALGQSVRP